MENYSEINPLLLSQPASVETIKNLRQQKDANHDACSLKKASQDFESILINFVINAMWKTIPKSDLFEENNAGMETYTEIMHTALSQDIVSKGGFGVAPVIYKHLMRENEGTEKSIGRDPLSRGNNDSVHEQSVDEGASVNTQENNDTNGVSPS